VKDRVSGGRGSGARAPLDRNSGAGAPVKGKRSRKDRRSGAEATDRTSGPHAPVDRTSGQQAPVDRTSGPQQLPTDEPPGRLPPDDDKRWSRRRN
jgi:hypothetical protein